MWLLQMLVVFGGVHKCSCSWKQLDQDDFEVGGTSHGQQQTKVLVMNVSARGNISRGKLMHAQSSALSLPCPPNLLNLFSWSLFEAAAPALPPTLSLALPLALAPASMTVPSFYLLQVVRHTGANVCTAVLVVAPVQYDWVVTNFRDM